MRLERPAVLNGTVRGHDGRPLPDVPVVTFVRGGTGARTTTRTGADGSFAFGDLQPGTNYVTAHPAGHAGSSWQTVVLTAAATTTVELQVEPGHTVRGTVRDAETGMPIAGAELAATWTLRPCVVSAADGSFELRGLDEHAEIHVRAAGYATDCRTVKTAPEPTTCDLRLVRGDTLVGRVVAADGTGLGTAYVAAGADEWNTHSGLRTCWCTATVDAAGRFRIDHLARDAHGRPRAWQLLVRAPGQGSRVLALPYGRLANGTLDVGDIALAEQGLLEGRVVDGEGHPVADAGIELRGTPNRADELVPGHTDIHVLHHFQKRRTRTAADGTFRIAGLAAGSYTVSATPRGVSWDVPSGPHTVAAGTVVAVPDLVADAGLTITGRVRRTGGHPLPTGATLQIVAHGPGNSRRGTVAADGTFVLERLERGEFVLAGDDAPAGYAVVPRAGVAAGSTAVELELAVATTIEGQVVDADGKPVRGAAAYYFPNGVGTARNVRTDADGRFRLEVPPGVLGKLGATHPDAEMCQAHQTDVAAGTLGILLRLPPLRSQR